MLSADAPADATLTPTQVWHYRGTRIPFTRGLVLHACILHVGSLR